MKVSAHSVVKFEYELWIDGSKVEGTEAGHPRTILMGHALDLPKGLEAALLGKEAGSYTVILPPEQGYGYYEPALRTEARVADLPDTPRLGAGFSAEGSDGSILLYRVVAIEGETAILDANPPFAGKELEYRFTIHQVREAEKGELEHGHVHGEGGVHHH